MVARRPHAPALSGEPLIYSPAGGFHGSTTVVCLLSDLRGGDRWRYLLRGFRHLPPRRSSYPPAELPELPPAWTDRPGVVPQLRVHASLGQGDQNRGAHSKDAALVRRFALRPLRQRPHAQAERHRHASEVG